MSEVAVPDSEEDTLSGLPSATPVYAATADRREFFFANTIIIAANPDVQTNTFTPVTEFNFGEFGEG
ncbi:MAG: hypothetical protein GDA53_07175 [Rhodobacteraceae bacterium]|nr:hypothetical protein [Paracoccaceae bacterium]